VHGLEPDKKLQTDMSKNTACNIRP